MSRSSRQKPARQRRAITQKASHLGNFPVIICHEFTANQRRTNSGDDTCGKFVIGLRDDLEDEISDDESPEATIPQQNHKEGESLNSRTLLRTLHLEMAGPVPSGDDTGKAALGNEMIVTNQKTKR
jgi:hypothetical protein